MSEKSERDKKVFQSYLDNIKAKTGKTPADFRALAKEKGLTKAGEVVAWLKQDFGLGYGHAGAIWHLIGHADDAKASPDARLAKLFAGKKAMWRRPYDVLATKISKFGPEVELSANMTYINMLRKDKKFAILQPSTAERLDIGLKLKGVKPTERLQAAGSWNAMVTHRVRISDPKQIDKEILAWLKHAYDAAQGESPMENKRRDQRESDLPVELAQPAQRALAAAGIQRLAQLTKFSEGEVKQLHGLGPNALAQLQRALSAKGLAFADWEEKEKLKQ